MRQQDQNKEGPKRDDVSTGSGEMMHATIFFEAAFSVVLLALWSVLVFVVGG